MNPKKITIQEKKLKIIWQNESESKISLDKLRRFCPCAICDSERKSQSNSYFPLYTLEQLQVTKINTVGNYAISVSWKDGHSTGIYDYQFLLNLAID